MGSISKIGGLTFPRLSDFSAPTKHVPPAQPIEDQVQIAAVSSSVQVEQLQSTSPSSLQAVFADAIY